MYTRTIVRVGILTVLLAAPLRAGEVPCIGDCDSNSDVNTSDLVLLTNVALGRMPSTACEAGDPGNDGVGITDLVQSVFSSMTHCGTVPPPSATPTPSITPTPTLTPSGVANTATPTATDTPTGPPSCGDGVVQEGEQCDDRGICTSVGEVQRCTANDQCAAGQTCSTAGFCNCSGANTGCPSGQECSADGFCFLPCTGPKQCPTGECRPVGGDGCAANCTNETTRPGQFIPCQGGVSCSTSGPDCAGSCVQSVAIPVPVSLQGTTELITGDMRGETVMGPDGQVITNPGEVPISIKASGTRFMPTSVFNQICACVKSVPNPLFGPGNAGAGIVGCGDQGLVDTDFLVEQDHNTTPGNAGNSGPAAGFPDDPECDETIPTQGVPSLACKEQEDAACMEPRFLHPGVCNSPRRITFSGGRKPKGSILLFNSTAITQLSDGGACRTEPLPGACPFPDYGPDCIPCTRDDTPEVVVNVTPTTSGKASVRIIDTNSSAGAQRLEAGAVCNGPPCKVEETGELVDCQMLEGNNSLGGVLATAFPGIDSMTLRDTVTTTTLAAGPPAQ